MICEYALDPALVACWHDRKEYLFFEEKFGINTRRIISIYPKKSKWQKMIWDAFNTGSAAEDENAKLRLGALIGKLAEDAIKRKSTFSDIPAWIDRAEKEHGERPFWAILTDQVGRANPAVINAGNLVNSGHSLWSVPDLPMTPRRASDLADVMAPILRVCKHAIFIDPYFDPEKPRWQRPFKARMEKIFEWRNESGEIIVELHTSIDRFFGRPDSPIRTDENEKNKYSELVTSCEDALPSLIPKGIKLKLVIWKKRENGQELHNRYVLTEFAGIFLGTGLDESSNPDSETKDNVMLLPCNQRTDCWQQYSGASPAFDYAGNPVEIIGKK